jgi:hypothetical protein
MKISCELRSKLNKLKTLKFIQSSEAVSTEE